MRSTVDDRTAGASDLTAGPLRRTVSLSPHDETVEDIVHNALCVVGAWPVWDREPDGLTEAMDRVRRSALAVLAEPGPTSPRSEPSEPVRCALGVDVGGSDLKLSLRLDGATVSRHQARWEIPPAALPSAHTWAEVIAAHARDRIAAAARSGWTVERLGLSLPDVVRGGRIVFGHTGKTAGMRAALGADFEVHRRTVLASLPARVGALVGLPVVAVGDGVAAALAAPTQPGRTLCLSLGTSITGAVRQDGEVQGWPLYASGLRLGGPWSGPDAPRHDVLDVAGTWQHGPTQKGALVHAPRFGLAPPDGDPRRWLDALRRSDAPAALALLAHLGETLGAGVDILSAWLGPFDGVLLTGALVAPTPSGRATTALLAGASSPARAPMWVHTDATFAQADAVARLAGQGA